jgi:RHS repeat-associated protein
MVAPARFWLEKLRRRSAAFTSLRPTGVALALTILVSLVLLPAPWDGAGARAAKPTQPEREVTELRSARTKTIRQPDGSLKTILSQQSLHFLERQSKAWRDIDASFAASTTQDAKWRSGKNRFSVSLAEETKAGFLTFDSAGGSITLSLADATIAKGLKTKDNTVVFKEALKDVDLEYVVLPDGLKENIVLKKAGAPNEYRFRLAPASGDAFQVEERADGSVSFFGSDPSAPAFTLLPPLVGDAGGPGGSFVPAPGKVSMDIERDGEDFVVTLSIDAGWLSSSERVYPVTLDPTLYVQPDIADGEYNTTAGGNPNVTAAEIRTGRDGSGGPKYAGVLTFDLATIPPAAKVLDARVNSYLAGCFPTACGTGHTGDVELRRLASGWSSSTPWSAVTVDATLQGKISFSTTPALTWHRWSGQPLTQTVQGMINGSIANYGFILDKNGGNDAVGYGWRSARWSDPSFAPYLEVYWVADGVQLNPSVNLHANGAELYWQHYAGGTSAYADAVFADSPSAYWRLDEGAGATSAWDWSGSSRTATYSGGYTLGASGALADLDTAVRLDGLTGLASVPGISLANTSFTLEAWAKRDSINTYDWIIGQGSGTTHQGLHFGFRNTNQFTCAFWSNDLNTPIYTDTDWHHWACTYNAATRDRRIYRDGVLVASDTAAANYAGTGTLQIGNAPPIAGPYAGTIDEVAIYPSALSQAQVSAHHAAAPVPLPGFQRFEIHRSSSPNFTPSPATLIGTVADAAIQTYRDTTAKPAATFYYEVVTVTSEGSFSSNELRADLPAQGLGTVTIQPGFLTGFASATHISSATPTIEAGNSQGLVVGSSGTNQTRTLISFDMHVVPTNATVSSARLEMYALQSTPAVNLHAVTASWTEGGATWNHRDKYANLSWTTPGGDFQASVTSSSAGGQHQHWDSWELGPLLQQWISGAQAHNGLLLKYGSENGAQPTLTYAADGYARSIALRPRLVITYEDGSQAVSPTVAIAEPQANELVTGTVTVKAGALDDGSVSKVEFFLDTDPLGAPDTVAPYEVSWNTTSATRGTHTLTARATDDAGNQTTSQPVQVTVANSSAPTTTVTSAAPQGGGQLNTPPTANASSTPASGSAPLTVDFTGAGSDPDGSITQWAWDLDGDGAYDDSNVQNPSFAYTANGVYYARLRVTDNQGAFGFSTPLTITVADPPSAPTVVGTPFATSANNPTSGTWTIPTGWQAGDLLVTWWYARSNTKNVSSTGGPALTNKVNHAASDYGHLYVYYRRLQTGDANPTFSSNSVNNSTTVWGALVLRGVSSSGDPFEAASAPTTWQNAINPNPPAVTTQTANAFVLAMFGKNNDYTSITPPAGYTARGNHSNTAGSDAAGGAASIVKASPGSEDPGAWTLGGGSSSDDGITWTASVKPGGAGNAQPTASASANPTSGAAPLTVAFTGTGADPDGSITAWAWDLDGDGLYDDSSVQSPSHEYAQPGTFTARLRVTDNAGAYGFSGPVTLTVLGSGQLSPLWDVTASAADDFGVAKVEFYVDGDRFATDDTSPFAATLDTLAFPSYDGAHTLTTKAYDADGNVTTSAAHPITVANAAGTKYKATIATSNVPLEQTWDPGGGAQDGAPLTVSLTNTSTQSWPAASIKLRYRWFSGDATPAVTDSANVSIGATDLGAGQQRNLSVTVDPPALPSGVYRARYKLRLDLYDTAASAYFAGKGNAPYETWVTVTREVVDELGLERYQQYDGEDLGGGFDHALNLANGNNVVQWVPFSQRGRGLNTVVTMTYNSLEAGSVSPLGNNWSLSISSLTPVGLPLDVHPNAADIAAGRTQKWIGFTDGDGSYHVFTGNAAGTYYTAPPGVHLYLKQTAGGWELVKPDRTKFVFNAAGFPTSVEDANGNALTFTLATPAAGEDAYGLARRVTSVTDAGGRDFTLAYYSRAETPTPALRGKLERLTDHVGHALKFTYYEDGNLRSIREKGGIGDDGVPTPDREVVFTYTTPDGAGPAIASFANRQNPDPATVQSHKLFSVIDFRGSETQFAYSTAADAKKWRLVSRKNRTSDETTFGYDTTARTTTATMPLSRVWTYSFDIEGRVTQIDDPVNTAHTTIEWADQTAPNEVTNTVRKVTAPSGEFVEYAYNANGYKTDEWDELRNRQSFEFENLAVDANDASGNWEPGRSIPHLSQLAAVVKPRGNATAGNPDDYRWEFSYTPTGLLATITDPLGNVTTNAWNANGTLASQTLPNNGDTITRTTTYNAYDANGLPTQVTDAAGGVARAGYAANGNLLWEQDPNHGSYSGGTAAHYRTEHRYDAFGRLVSTSKPKSTSFTPGMLIWESTEYDANDNEIAQRAASYGRGNGRNGALTQTTFDAMDRETLVVGPRTAAQGGPVKTKTEYDAAGRLTRVTKPKGVDSAPADDYVTETTYDLLDRELSITQHATESGATRVTKHCYDDAGDLRSVTGPKGSAGLTSCPNPEADPYVYTTATHTTKFEYDDAHRQIKATDALGRITQTAYDENGQVISETDEANKVTETLYDDRGAKAKLVEPFDTGRTLTTQWEYDPLGNVTRLISPRAFDAAGGQAPYTDFLESYSYDALSRLVTTTLPTGPGANQYFGSVMGSGPSAYWRFGGSGVDVTGNGYNLQLYGTANAPGALSGDPDTALSCGGGGYCAVSPDMGFPNVSIEAWIKTSASGSEQIIATTPDWGFTFKMTGGGALHLKRTTDISRNGWTATTGGGYNDGQWHHVVAVTNNADGPRIYVDGVLASGCYQCTGGSVYYNLPGGNTIVVGGTYGGGYFTGSIDEMAVFNRSLSATEVANHYAARLPAQTTQAYRHQAYDANGQTLWTSLATTASTPIAVTQAEKTTLAYWDTGAIYSSQDPASSKVRFDYTAEGWQASRVAELTTQPGTLDIVRSMSWEYYPDGFLRAHVDQESERALYSYDGNGNRTTALEATGVVAPGQTVLQVDLSYNSLDELVKVRTPISGSANFRATTLAYDLHGNTAELVDNREENASGGQTAAGRVFAYGYNAGDQVIAQIDDFATPGTASDDQQITYTYHPTGELHVQWLQKGGAGAWVNEQSSVKTYFDNGLLKMLQNRKGDASNTVVESHTLSYIRNNVYLNGNRASDAFFLKGPDAGAACYHSWQGCQAQWIYDARERLVQDTDGAGKTTVFTVDVQGNVTHESGTGGSVSRTYSGLRLQTQTQAGQTTRFLYDSAGNTDCTVRTSYSGPACPAPGHIDLIDDSVYDYRNALVGYRYYAGAASPTKTSDYTVDPLERPVRQVDWVSPNTTTINDFTYVGVTNALSKEVKTYGNWATKRYSYDAFGQRATIAETISSTTNRYSYLYDPHTSVSLLLDQANAVKESYGYSAYGAANAALTKTASGFSNTTNPYRYTGKRLDSGSGTYDMGARRYSASTGRFLQYDLYYNALDNLGLAEDPLTQNRYALAGANPVNFVEVDGHRASRENCYALTGKRQRNCFAKYNRSATEDPWPEMLVGGVGGLVRKGVKEGAQAALGIAGKEGAEAAARGSKSTIGRGYDRVEDVRTRATGPGTVPKSERDPRRYFSRKDKEKRLESTGGVCDDCRNPLPAPKAKGHHNQRHADGGRTSDANLRVLCADCHGKRHRRSR